VRMPDPDLRASAYQELYRVYGQDGPILGQMYQTLVRDWRNEVISLRGYQQPISARNLHNDIPDGVVDTLLSVCEQNRGIFQRFFKLKARLLNMDKLRRYDIYAPMAGAARQYDYGQAVSLIMDAFSQFDPRFADMALAVINEGHVDSEIRKGKRSGAFCATINPDLTPWILANYQGHSDDVATLAHELGHAIHSLMASQHSIFTQHACLPLAETASTFGEMMLVDRLLSDESDADVRRNLLFRQVDDAYATIMRQAFFAMFEKTAHEMIEQGASVDALTDAYLKNMHTQFGDALDIGEEFRWEWVSIPTSTTCLFMSMPMPLGSCWCFRFTSNISRIMKVSSRATCRSFPRAVPRRRWKCFPGLDLMSARHHSGRAVSMWWMPLCASLKTWQHDAVRQCMRLNGMRRSGQNRLFI